MSTQKDVRLIALSLPGVTEDEGSFHLRVAGKGFAWVYPERVHPKKPRVPNPEVLVISVADLGEKEALLAGDPAKFFTTPHYDGYRAVLVRLPAVEIEELTQLVTDAWRCQTPKHLLDSLPT
ncbi:MAG TPA: MmcQ/YjbR family DNA-binding protein [Acidimicrobiia bacterium]|nr:MmcQ/YjbR family DNA-binding protein [Acidimicrobiia bacterium]